MHINVFAPEGDLMTHQQIFRVLQLRLSMKCVHEHRWSPNITSILVVLWQLQPHRRSLIMIYNPCQKAIPSGLLHQSLSETACHNKENRLDSDVPLWATKEANTGFSSVSLCERKWPLCVYSVGVCDISQWNSREATCQCVGLAKPV